MLKHHSLELQLFPFAGTSDAYAVPPGRGGEHRVSNAEIRTLHAAANLDTNLAALDHTIIQECVLHIETIAVGRDICESGSPASASDVPDRQILHVGFDPAENIVGRPFDSFDDNVLVLITGWKDITDIPSSLLGSPAVPADLENLIGACDHDIGNKDTVQALSLRSQRSDHSTGLKIFYRHVTDYYIFQVSSRAARTSAIILCPGIDHDRIVGNCAYDA
jgi:hypothetical protein